MCTDWGRDRMREIDPDTDTDPESKGFAVRNWAALELWNR